MNVLPYANRPDGLVAPTASLTLHTGKEVWLCDEFPALKEALDAGKPFVAHAIVALRPKELVVNPVYVVSVEAIE